MKTLARVAALAALAVLVALVAVPSATAQGGRTYEVTVTNLTENQILTPPAFAAHHARANIFDIGRPASPALREVAENGNLTPLADALANRVGVRASGVGGGADGPLPPGTDRTFQFVIGSKVRLFSAVQMVVCTNDGFTGIDALKLPRENGKTRTVLVYAMDAGTEMNTNALEDFVPPCSGDGIGTGSSNPDLAQAGVVAPHPGLDGEAETDWAFNPLEPVAMYEITRTS